MSKLSIFAALLVLGVAQGSLFGPFGPFGPFGQQAPQQPGWGVFPSFPAFGPPSNALPFSRTLPTATAGASSTVGKFRAKPSGVLERLAVATLPEDLQARYVDLLVALEEGNTTCDETYPALGAFSGLHRRCVVLQKAETERFALALEQEANDRAAAVALAESATDNVNAVVV